MAKEAAEVQEIVGSGGVDEKNLSPATALPYSLQVAPDGPRGMHDSAGISILSIIVTIRLISTNISIVSGVTGSGTCGCSSGPRRSIRPSLPPP